LRFPTSSLSHLQLLSWGPDLKPKTFLLRLLQLGVVTETADQTYRLCVISTEQVNLRGVIDFGREKLRIAWTPSSR
jgi:hypothetical protein